MKRYTGKLVLMAGAAHQAEPLNHALAQAFTAEGATVVVLDPLLNEPRSLSAAVENVAREHGHIDVLVTNYLLPMPREAALAATDLTPDVWEAQQRRFFALPAAAAHAAGRIMLTQGGGSIVHLGSVHGLFAQVSRAAYCSAAAGLFMHTKALAVEWGARNVRVNAIACGVLPEDAAESALPTEPTLPGEQTLLSRIPMGRSLKYPELCEAALFLGGDEASFVTGEVLRVDGGWTAYHLFYPFETAF